MERIWYVVSFVNLDRGTFHQLLMSNLALKKIKTMDHIQLLNSQYAANQSLA